MSIDHLTNYMKKNHLVVESHLKLYLVTLKDLKIPQKCDLAFPMPLNWVIPAYNPYIYSWYVYNLEQSPEYRMGFIIIMHIIMHGTTVEQGLSCATFVMSDHLTWKTVFRGMYTWVEYDFFPLIWETTCLESLRLLGRRGGLSRQVLLTVWPYCVALYKCTFLGHNFNILYACDNSTIPEKTACRNLCSSTRRPSESNICSNVAAVSRVHRFRASTRVCACSEVDLIRLGSSGGYCICSKSTSRSPGLSGKPHSLKKQSRNDHPTNFNLLYLRNLPWATLFVCIRVGVGMNRSASGGQKMNSTLSGSMDWILRYIKTTCHMVRLRFDWTNS